MLIRRPDDVLPSEITSEAVWRSRRDLMLRTGAAAAAVGLSGWATRAAQAQEAGALPGKASPAFSVMDKQTSLSDVTSYNNYYEFGVDKGDPAKNAGKLQTQPWTVSVEGEVNKPRTFSIEELLKLAPMEDRVYRLRSAAKVMALRELLKSIFGPLRPALQGPVRCDHRHCCGRPRERLCGDRPASLRDHIDRVFDHAVLDPKPH